MLGEFRDGHPRGQLIVAGSAGPFEVEFIVDTGFEGDLALPGHLARQLGDAPTGMRDRGLANGAIIRCAFYDLDVDRDGEPWRTEVLVLEGSPLIGTRYLLDCLLQVEVTEGGGVSIEAL